MAFVNIFSLIFHILKESFIIDCHPAGVSNKHFLLSLFTFVFIYFLFLYIHFVCNQYDCVFNIIKLQFLYFLERVINISGGLVVNASDSGGRSTDKNILDSDGNFDVISDGLQRSEVRAPLGSNRVVSLSKAHLLPKKYW